jgi:hypothetical protein
MAGELGSSNTRWAGFQTTFVYCTVTVTVVARCAVPEVPVTVTV